MIVKLTNSPEQHFCSMKLLLWEFWENQRWVDELVESGQAGQGWYLMPAMTGCLLYGASLHTLIRDEMTSAWINIVKTSVIEFLIKNSGNPELSTYPRYFDGNKVLFLEKPISFLEPEIKTNKFLIGINQKSFLFSELVRRVLETEPTWRAGRGRQPPPVSWWWGPTSGWARRSGAATSGSCGSGRTSTTTSTSPSNWSPWSPRRLSYTWSSGI